MTFFAVFAAACIVALLEVATRRRWAPRWPDRDIHGHASRTAQTARLTVAFAAALWAALTWQQIAASVAFAAVGWLFALAFSTDLASMRIPREPCWLVFGIAAGAVLATGSTAAYASAFAAFLAIGLTGLLTALVTKGGLGSGDVRLLIAAAPLAGWVGYSPILFGVIIAALVQAAVRITLWAAKKTKDRKGYPFAPALVVGLVVAMLALQPVSDACRDWAGALAC